MRRSRLTVPSANKSKTTGRNSASSTLHPRPWRLAEVGTRRVRRSVMNGKALEEGLTNCLPMARGYRDRASASMALSLAPLEDSGGPRMTPGTTTRHLNPSDADS